MLPWLLYCWPVVRHLARVARRHHHRYHRPVGRALRRAAPHVVKRAPLLAWVCAATVTWVPPALTPAPPRALSAPLAGLELPGLYLPGYPFLGAQGPLLAPQAPVLPASATPPIAPSSAPTPTAVPEPSTLLLLGAALGVFSLWMIFYHVK